MAPDTWDRGNERKKPVPPPTVLLRSEQSSGQVAVICLTASAGFAGPPLHVHDFDEASYVLEGEVTFQLEDELITVANSASYRLHLLGNGTAA